MQGRAQVGYGAVAHPDCRIPGRTVDFAKRIAVPTPREERRSGESIRQQAADGPYELS